MDCGLSEIHSAGISGVCVYRARFRWGFICGLNYNHKTSWLQSCLGKKNIYNWKLTTTPNRNEHNKTTFSEAGAHKKADPNFYLLLSSAKLGLQPHHPGTTCQETENSRTECLHNRIGISPLTSNTGDIFHIF